MLFTGKKLEAPRDRGCIMLYDLDAEHLNAGFSSGDDDFPEAVFYGYLVPRPPNCGTAPTTPRHANWVEAMGEWLLPYEAVRTSEDPRKATLEFLQSLSHVLTDAGLVRSVRALLPLQRPVRSADWVSAHRKATKASIPRLTRRTAVYAV